MTIIKTLILKEWYKSFSISAVIFYLLLTISNLIAGLLRSSVNSRDVILNHLVETPVYSKLILPISCLIASLFAINKLKNRNELTAILASGYSRKKLIFNIATAASLVFIIQFLALSYIAPFLKSKRHYLIKNSGAKFRNLKSKGLKSSTIGTGHIWYKNNKYFFSFEAYSKIDNSLSNVTAYIYNGFLDKDDILIEKIIRSPKAIFNPERGWIMKDAKIIKNLNSDGFPQIEYSRDKISILPISEKPKDFKQIEADITTLNIVRLFSYIKKLSQNGINVNEYMVLFLEKISIPFTCIIFALLSSISLFYPNRRDAPFAKNFALIFIFTISYWLVDSYFIQLGINSKLNPFIACFGIPIIFSLFLTMVFYKNQRLQ